MNTEIHCYSGTGNSLWAARRLASELGGARVSLLRTLPPGPVPVSADAFGLVFPVHIFGVAGPIRRLLARLEVPAGTYVLALAVNAGMSARSLPTLKAWLARRRIRLAAGFSLALPSNYLPWGGPGSPEEQSAQFDAARLRLAEIAEVVRERRELPVERGPFLLSLLLSGIYQATSPLVARMDRSFRADPSCTGCGICAKVCPAGNITLADGRPQWRHRCEQCLACLHWCPEAAIQYGRNTAGRPRYHHPEVTLQQILGE
jgi:ferredoxin